MLQTSFTFMFPSWKEEEGQEKEQKKHSKESQGTKYFSLNFCIHITFQRFILAANTVTALFVWSI